MADVFISYAQEDRARAQTLAEEIARRGYTVWWDYDLVGGSRYRKAILDELLRARSVLVIWSAHSVESHFVEDEAERARAAGTLIPLRTADLDVVKIPLGFGGYQTLPVDQPERIVEAVKALGARPGPTMDWDHKLFKAYVEQRDRVGIKPGAKPGEMLVAMIGGDGRRTELAHLLRAEWKNWFDQPEHARPKERVIQLRVSPTSPALVPFALFLNEAVAKLLKEDLGQARPTMPTYLAVGVGESSREGDSVADFFARIRQSLSKNSPPIDLSRPQELVDAVTAAHAYARQRNESFTVQSVLAGPHGPRVMKAVESVCHECALRKTPHILVPLDDSAPGPLRQIFVDLFKAPDKISPNIKRNAVAYEIDFRPDLVTPRTRVQELVDAVRAALLQAQQNGIAATREAILAGPHGSRVRKAFESVCEEFNERRSQRVILPIPNVANDPVRKMISELFREPSKVSSKIQAGVAFELECRG